MLSFLSKSVLPRSLSDVDSASIYRVDNGIEFYKANCQLDINQ